MSETGTVPLPMPYMPRECGQCGRTGAAWPLGVYGGRLNLICPNCQCVVAAVVAVADHHRHYPQGAVNHDPFGWWPNIGLEAV